ncbi:MAG: hypothetical protein R3D85_03635 [Paracoccaceae bacterium]
MAHRSSMPPAASLEAAAHWPAPSFEVLGRAVRQDVHPRTFLDALDAAGTVRIDGDSV